MALEPLDRGDVEMVGRLVEQHQVRAAGHQPGQGGAPALAPRGGGRVEALRHPEPVHRRLGPPALAFLEIGGGVVAEAGMA